jgi:hypothetical protein
VLEEAVGVREEGEPEEDSAEDGEDGGGAVPRWMGSADEMAHRSALAGSQATYP